MRESTMWASQGGPIIGEIKNGKKYPFGTVPATEYDADMQALRTEIAGLNTEVVSCEGTLSGLQTALDTLAGQYAATVPGLSQSISDLRVQVGDVSAALTAATQSLTASISAVDIKADSLITVCNQRFADLGGRVDTLAAKEAGDVETLTGRLDTAASDLRSTQITVRDHTTSINALTGRMTAAEDDIQGLDLTLREHSSEISSQGETIGILSSDLGAVTDLATATSATTAANSEAITGIRDAITQMRASITANATAINAFNAAITELTATQSADRATLTARIQAAENSVTALAQTVESYNTTLSNQISGLRADMTVNSQDIAVIKSTLQTQGAAIASAEDRCTAVESRMNAQEVGMATLRQQLFNSVMNLEDEIGRINTDVTAIRTDIAALSTELNSFMSRTENALSNLNERVTALEGGGEPLEILSFTASPDLCEIGGSENIILNWNVKGAVKTMTINGNPVTGTSLTVPNVTEPTTFTLIARDASGAEQQRSVSITFVNHVYWGTSASPNATEGTVKALDSSDFADQRTRTFTVSPYLEYIYYAYPKRLGTSEFMVNDFTGGFEDPAVISIDNHSGFTEDYYVYRSANKLSSTFEVHVL